jgi:alpha-1,4-galacturonosyltransferase
MKGHYQHSSPLLPPKRRCSGLAAAVPALVVCSVLLPLAFLLGLHRPGTYAAPSDLRIPTRASSSR